VITKRDIKVLFISIIVFTLCFILFNQGIDEAAAQKNKQLGQQTQTELLPLNIDQFTAILENQQIATKGDVDAISKELEVMQKELQTITQEGATRDQIICTLLLKNNSDFGRYYEKKC
jgi:hypothetical protein